MCYSDSGGLFILDSLLPLRTHLRRKWARVLMDGYSGTWMHMTRWGALNEHRTQEGLQSFSSKLRSVHLNDGLIIYRLNCMYYRTRHSKSSLNLYRMKNSGEKCRRKDRKISAEEVLNSMMRDNFLFTSIETRVSSTLILRFPSARHHCRETFWGLDSHSSLRRYVDKSFASVLSFDVLYIVYCLVFYVRT